MSFLQRKIYLKTATLIWRKIASQLFFFCFVFLKQYEEITVKAIVKRERERERECSVMKETNNGPRKRSTHWVMVWTKVTIIIYAAG